MIEQDVKNRILEWFKKHEKIGGWKSVINWLVVIDQIPKIYAIVKLVLRNIIGLRKGKTHVTKEIQAWRNNP